MPSSSSPKRATAAASADGPAVIVQWSYGGVCASTRTAPTGSTPSRPNSSRLGAIMQAAPTWSAQAAGADPRKRLVPGHVDPAVDQVRHLPLVVGVEDVVEVEVGRVPQPRTEPVPDRDDVRIVGDRPKQHPGHQTSPSSGRP